MILTKCSSHDEKSLSHGQIGDFVHQRWSHDEKKWSGDKIGDFVHHSL